MGAGAPGGTRGRVPNKKRSFGKMSSQGDLGGRVLAISIDQIDGIELKSLERLNSRVDFSHSSRKKGEWYKGKQLLKRTQKEDCGEDP